MQLIPQGYIARYNLEDLYQLVNENLKKLGKELSKPEPVSSVVNGKTVRSFEARDLPGRSGASDKPKKKYNYTKKPKPEQVLAEDDYQVGYSYIGTNGTEITRDEVLAGPVRPL